MKLRAIHTNILILVTLAFAFVLATSDTVLAKTAGGSLRGQVTDPSGATVGGATIVLTKPDGSSLDVATNKDGGYEAKGLLPGKYTVKAVAEGFGLFTAVNVAITAGQIQILNIALTIEEQKVEVQVNDSPTQLDVDPQNNAGAIILNDKDLESLSDDPDELQSELQALAGPSVGPNGGQI